MTLKEAFGHVLTKRPCVGPNMNFIHQLIKYEKKLYKKNSFRWVNVTDRYGAKQQVPDFYMTRADSHYLSTESGPITAKTIPRSSLSTSSETSTIIDRQLSDSIKNNLPV